MSAIFLVSAWCLLCSVGAGVREEVYAAGRVGNAGDDVALHNMVRKEHAKWDGETVGSNSSNNSSSIANNNNSEKAKITCSSSTNMCTL